VSPAFAAKFRRSKSVLAASALHLLMYCENLKYFPAFSVLPFWYHELNVWYVTLAELAARVPLQKILSNDTIE
jgi:hypothetical protein